MGTTVGAARTRAPVRAQARELLWAGLHLAVLWSLAFAQPLFDILKDNAAFFAVRGSPSSDVVLFAVTLVAVPPLALVVLEVIAAAVDHRLRQAVHLVFVAGLVAVIALSLFKRVGSASSGVLIPLSIIAGVAAAALYRAAAAARSFLTVLSPTPLLFLVVFLFFSPIHKLIGGSNSQARAIDVSGHTPLFMVVLDELPTTSLLGRDGNIDAVRYPHFAALAHEGYWFRNASTIDSFTTNAVPAILTGRLPRKGELPVFDDHPENLFTLLGSGYRLHVQESITRLCPEDLCARQTPGFRSRMESLGHDLAVVSLHLLLPDDLRRGLPAIDSTWGNFGKVDTAGGKDSPAKPTGSQLERQIQQMGPDQNRTALVRRFARETRRSGTRPALDFFHLLLPHVPWQYLPDGTVYGQGELRVGYTDGVWAKDPDAAVTGYQRHLLQLEFLDRQLGILLGRLKSIGAYDKSLVVVLADHGMSFVPGQSGRKISPVNAQAIMPMPLFIKAPGQRRGKTIATHVRTIDVLPTIAALLKIGIPWRVDGRSMFSPGADRRSLTTTVDGELPVTLTASELDSRRADALRHQLALFGAGDDRPGLYGAGRYPKLLGRRVQALPHVSPKGLSATVDYADAFRTVAPTSGFAPVHVTGHVSSPRISAVAIAVNGVIGSVPGVVLADGASAFSTILPRGLLRDGANRIEVLAIQRTAGRVTVASLTRTAASQGGYALTGTTMRGPGGTTARVVDGAVAGAVDMTRRDDQVVRLSGWAADGKTYAPVDRIVAFVDGQFRFSGVPDGARDDIAQAHGVAGERLAYGFQLPVKLIGSGREPVDVYGIRGGVASRLEWYCSPGARQEVGC